MNSLNKRGYMKKILFTILSLIMVSSISFAYTANPNVLNSINDNQIVDYNPTTKIWSRNLGLKDYVFTKHVSVGTGSFSEYVYKGTQYDINSTYEFLFYGKLIGYNAHLLKFFDFTFNGKDFEAKELTKEQVQFLFPYIKIIMVSDFKDNEITIESPIFRKRAYMILNDTDRDFYKYQFEYYKANDNVFKGIFETSFPRVLIYSHFKSRDELFPILKINIKPILKETEISENETDIDENESPEAN